MALPGLGPFTQEEFTTYTHFVDQTFPVSDVVNSNACKAVRPTDWKQRSIDELAGWHPQLRPIIVARMNALLHTSNRLLADRRDAQEMREYLQNTPMTTHRYMDKIHQQRDKSTILIAGYQSFDAALKHFYHWYEAQGPAGDSHLLEGIAWHIHWVHGDLNRAEENREFWRSEMQRLRAQSPRVFRRGKPGNYARDRASNRGMARARQWPNVPLQPWNMSNEPEGTWHTVKQFEAGAMGKTYLKLKVDRNGRVVSRMVVKFTKYGTNPWFPTQWRLRPDGTRWPLEWLTQTAVSRGQGARHALRTLGEPIVTQQDNGNGWVQMKLPYAALGDLSNMLTAHSQADQMIPEPFLWLCLLALAETALIMKQGGLAQQVGNWEQVVHRDLKPENVFLDFADPGHFPHFPKPLVADWGLAFFTDETDPANPFLHTDAGTPGHLAPEQPTWIDDYTGEMCNSVKILSPCNIFEIGSIMLSLMHLTNLYEDVHQNTRQQYNIMSPSWMMYSTELRDTVSACVEFQIYNRPTPETLLDFVNQHIANSNILQDAESGVGVMAMDVPIVHPEKAEYQLGFARKQDANAGAREGRGAPRVVNP
ncbi:hypothetical protein DOTSEDRAFT_22025 [Lecanosticta acicola]|uniref:non-specific serine/threonine protein kinase n=1 Tax=Lecanosticta acicola TaxID=111012 RepID=A0AAI8YP70_9PEZI|nr:hypothetical protein DOTSEDRAFT_22025 [Lecanosticta acicola]